MTSRRRRLTLAKALIRAHPEWGRLRIQRMMRERYGMSLRSQTLQDLIHVVRGTVPRRRLARERVELLSKLISIPERKPRLRFPSSIPEAPRLRSSDYRFQRYCRYPGRMTRPDLPHDIYVDVQTMRAVHSPPGDPMARRTEFLSIKIAAFTRDEFVRAWRSGTINDMITSRLREKVPDIKLSEVSVLGFWASKNPRI